MNPPRIRSLYPVLDVPDLTASSDFYAALLGGEVVKRDDDWHTLRYDGDSRLAFQLAPEHRTPNWPHGEQQEHLDFGVDDIRAAHEHALSVGAQQVTHPDDLDADSGFIAYTDPAGHPFCLVWGE